MSAPLTECPICGEADPFLCECSPDEVDRVAATLPPEIGRLTLAPYEMREHVLEVGHRRTMDETAGLTANLLEEMYPDHLTARN